MWPGRWVTSVTRPAEIGLSEDGREIRVLLLRRNVLIGGIMGAGKSGILNLVIANLAACPDVVLWGVDMKGGMELQPWAACFERLAFTPAQATRLFADAVQRLNERAARMAAEGKRVWEPTPEDPALVIICDEYAELPEEAHPDADSLSRRGRAVAVNLIAATQRPTQAAMGKDTAVRSQMDIRICLRVREPRDADLILGQGMVNSGWHAHKLIKPGEFLISGPEHNMPERNRAYLLDRRKDGITTQPSARRYGPGWQPASRTRPRRPQNRRRRPRRLRPVRMAAPRPDTALWDALNDAGPEGVSVAELEAACGMGRRWVYYRLQEHGRAGRAVQVRRGYWRAVRPSDGPSGDGRPPPRPEPGRPPRGPGR